MSNLGMLKVKIREYDKSTWVDYFFKFNEYALFAEVKETNTRPPMTAFTVVAEDPDDPDVYHEIPPIIIPRELTEITLDMDYIQQWFLETLAAQYIGKLINFGYKPDSWYVDYVNDGLEIETSHPLYTANAVAVEE